MFSAENSEDGYGNRVKIKTDVTYEFQGKEYVVYTAYAHLDSIDVKVGDKINQGDNLGKMGGTGNTTSPKYPKNYDTHVDLQTWIELDDGRTVNASPNLIQRQLVKKNFEKYGVPTMEVIKQQLQLPPGTIETWLGEEDFDFEPPGYPQEAENGFELAKQQGSPLVLDLDGDGIELPHSIHRQFTLT